MRIFVVEDDQSIRKLIEYALENADFDVVGFETGKDFFDYEELPDLILLDIMLPDMDGMEILDRLKKSLEYRNIPVIMLTARNSEYDIVSALDRGADDYITKPFGVMELISRIKAVLRRVEKNPKVLELRNLKIDEESRTVEVDGKEVYLTYKEFEILLHLMTNVGKVLTRGGLLDSIWGLDYSGETRTVDMHIASLRQKIGDGYITTVRGVGYKME